MEIKKRNTKITVSTDIVILLFTSIVLGTYQYGKNLSPEFLLFFIQIISLWFILKIIYYLLPKSKGILLFGLLAWGVVEAIWGLGQLYNYFPVKHSLFKTTGSFFNSGPYGGFIGLMFPLVLHFWLVQGNKNKNKNKLISYLLLFAGIVCLMVFPATLSRTAWIAAATGSMFVLLSNQRVMARMNLLRKRHKRECIIVIAVLILLLMIAVYGIYHLKKDSADGRLFMWKITAMAIKESPVQGTGIGGFPTAYAKAQIEYFKDGNGSDTEKLVAGSPEYAFNEYLQLFVEEGLLGFIIFLFLSFLIIRIGIRNRQMGAVGSFITLSVFAFASYPYQLWQFPVVWVILATICSAGTGKNDTLPNYSDSKKTVLSILAIAILFTGSIICASRQKIFYQARKNWKEVQTFYMMKAYESGEKEYERLYPVLNHKSKFVFEYGIILNAKGQRDKADTVFSRGQERSSDPMFYNVKGRNYHEMGEYDKAEECYTYSIWLLPERIYPYYLLTKLCADPANYQPEKMHKAAIAVLEKEPKIHSTAVTEMRNEVKKIIKEKGIGYD